MVETSLGYFINPLVTILLGVLVLSERLAGRSGWPSGIATLAIVVLTVDYGQLPWIALVARRVSFGCYGLLKKQVAPAPWSRWPSRPRDGPPGPADPGGARRQPADLRPRRRRRRRCCSRHRRRHRVPLLLFGAAAAGCR